MLHLVAQGQFHNRSILFKGIMAGKGARLDWMHVSYCPLLVLSAAQTAANGFCIASPYRFEIDNPFAGSDNSSWWHTVRWCVRNIRGLCRICHTYLRLVTNHVISPFCGHRSKWQTRSRAILPDQNIKIISFSKCRLQIMAICLGPNTWNGKFVMYTLRDDRNL